MVAFTTFILQKKVELNLVTRTSKKNFFFLNTAVLIGQLCVWALLHAHHSSSKNKLICSKAAACIHKPHFVLDGVLNSSKLFFLLSKTFLSIHTGLYCMDAVLYDKNVWNYCEYDANSSKLELLTLSTNLNEKNTFSFCLGHY